MSQVILKGTLVGIGAWGPGFQSWQELKTLLSDENCESDLNFTAPKPAIIPANERRRAPLPVRLAVETSSQACTMAEVDAKDLACVFASGLGDQDITDYMCKVLTTEEKLLSPTKFHNSVHNAPAGYWTISVGNMRPANSIAGYKESFALALLEGLSQACFENQGTLITVYDALSPEILKPVLPNDFACGISLAILPEGSAPKTTALAIDFSAKIVQDPNLEESVFSGNTLLSELFNTNPAAKLFPLLKAIGENKNGTFVSRLGPDSFLELTL